MAVQDGFIQSLHRMFLNGQMKEVVRGNDELFNTPLSSRWLKLPDSPHEPQDWEKAKQWQTILNGITRTSAIIFGTQQYHIMFDAAYDQNYQYTAKPSTIVVSTEPVKNPPPGFSLYDVVDTMVGQVIHETAHLRERQTDHPVFADDDILSLLHHLVEDVVIDMIIALQYPGFEGYLLKYRRYLIDGKLRKSWGMQREGRLYHFILSVRSTWPMRVSRRSVRRAYLYLLYRVSKSRTVEGLRRLNRAELAQQLYDILYEVKAGDHWRDPDVLSESLFLGADGPVVKGENGNNRGDLEVNPLSRRVFQDLDPKQIEWIEETVKSRQQDDSRPESARKLKLLSDHWADAFRHQKIPERKDRGITLEEQRMVHKLREEGLKPLTGVNGKYDYEVHLSQRPPSYQAGERYLSAVQAVRGQIVLLRNQFAWANAQVNRNQYGLISGDLDEDALYRAKFASDLFAKSTAMAHRSERLDIVLLVDASRSMLEPMQGSDVPKYVVAQRLSALFMEALAPVQSVRTWAFSYSSSGKTVDILELYAPELHADKTRIGDIYPANQTPEYQALLAVSEHIREVSRPHVPKVYIVLSDGRPEDDSMPLDNQAKEITKLAQRLRIEGNTIIQVAMSSEKSIRQMYPISLSFPEEGYPELVHRFGNLLKNKVMAQSTY